MTKLILIGASGHSKVIQDIVAENEDLTLYAIVDDAIEKTNEVNGIIYANTAFLSSLNVEEYTFCLAIGNNADRKKLFERLAIPLEQYETLIHPRAVISRSAKIGYGTVIMPNAVVNADAAVGNHCIVNTAAVVEHDNKLGDYVHVSPNVGLCGKVSVGEGSHVGIGAIVIPGKKVGTWSIVGAGAVVVKDVSDGMTVIGVPAKVIPKKRVVF